MIILFCFISKYSKWLTRGQQLWLRLALLPELLRIGPLQGKPLPNLTSLGLLAAVSLKSPNLSNNLNAFKTTFHRLVLPIVAQLEYTVRAAGLVQMLC